MLDTKTRPVNEGAPVLHERRRPGRIENASPELIALMRKPSAEAIKNVALYDAPNFVLPAADTSISVMHVMRFGMAFGICAAGWMAVFRAMMVAWG